MSRALQERARRLSLSAGDIREAVTDEIAERETPRVAGDLSRLCLLVADLADTVAKLAAEADLRHNLTSEAIDATGAGR